MNYPNTTRKTVVDLPTSYNRAASGPTTHGLFDESIIEISDSDSEDESISPRAHPSSNGRQCLSCTYINPLESARDNCGICEAPLQKTSVESQEELWTCVVCTLSNRPAARKCEACDFPKDRDRWAPKLKAPGDEGPPGVKSTPRSTWTCELCTLINVYASRVCSLCDAPCPLIVPPRSGPSHEGQSFTSRPTNNTKASSLASPLLWDCQSCGRRGIEHDFWMCGACGWIKTHSAPTK
jgi:hypothetical protein